MKLTDEQIIVFQDIYKKNFGENISREEAFNKGVRIVRLVELILKEKLLSEKKRK